MTGTEGREGFEVRPIEATVVRELLRRDHRGEQPVLMSVTVRPERANLALLLTAARSHRG